MSAPRGRKPDPHSERSVEVIPPGVVQHLEVPDGLSTDARHIWQIVVPFLAGRGALVASDVVLLIELVEVLAEAQRHRRAIAALVRRPQFLLSEDDQLEGSFAGEDVLEALALASPEVKRLRTGYLQCLKAASSLSSCFGLTPTDRIRLGIGGRDGDLSLGDVLREALGAVLAGGAVPTTAT